jgi:hypothetical protein
LIEVTFVTGVVFSSKKIFKFGVIESKMLTSVERGRITPSRAEEKEAAMRCDLVRTSTLALAFVGSIGLAAAQQQPPPNASPPANAVLVNGAFAVPGAPANTDTVPAKFSAKNAADDKLIIIAYTFKTLSDEERRAIYQALKGQPAAAFNADVGTELPPGVELHPVPNEVAARVPQTRGYRYVVANDRVLLVGTSRVVLGVFAD